MKFEEIFLPQSGYTVRFSSTEGKLSHLFESTDNSFAGGGEETNVMIYTTEFFKGEEILYKGKIFRSFVMKNDVEKIFASWINIISIKRIVTVMQEFESIIERQYNEY